MSDTQQGPGWWQASDGKWYAPEQQSPSAALPPPDVRPQPTPPPPVTPTTPFGAPESTGGKKPWWRRWWAITTAAVVALAVIAGIAGNASDDDPDEQVDPPVETIRPDDTDDTDGSADRDDAATGDAATGDAATGDSSSDDDQQASDDPPPPVDTTAPAAPVAGTRDTPIPIGQPTTIEIDSFGDGDGSVWTMTVVGPGTDMTRAVALENPFNDSPPEGSIFYGVPVSLTLDSANKEPLSTLFNLELEFYGPSTLSILDDGLELGCGVAPNEFDPVKEVFVGGTVDGVFCLAVPTEDVAAEALLTTDSVTGDRIFFATTGAAVEAPADGTDQAAPPPRADEPSVPGGRFDPYPIGEAVVVKVDSFGDGDGSVWSLTVEGPGADITQAIADENPFNEPPPEGSVFYGVPVSATLVAATKEPLALLFNLELEFYGPSTLSIIDLGVVDGCGVTPNEIDRVEEVFIDGTVSGTICLAVSNEDVAAGPLFTTDSIEGDRIYFATR